MHPVRQSIDDEKVYSVSEISALIKGLIEDRFPQAWIAGEISNCSSHSSGHTYFTLKDENAQLRCVLFSSNARRVRVRLENGLKVYARGRLTVYEKQGQYELIVSTVMPLGRGDLHLAFTKLKEKLEGEGLFAPERKKKLPRFPSRIAVVTSPTGAAVRDIIRAAVKIHAGVEIVVYPVRVQGVGAKEEIARALDDLDRIGTFDVVVLARGGGSIEDLWAFNEEIVARAISRSRLPVVSAVGHEIDFTIADFVADARAPTPSAAPTLVLADYVDVRARIHGLMRQSASAVGSRIERHLEFLASLRTHYGLRRMNDRLVTAMRDTDDYVTRAHHSVAAGVDGARSALAEISARLEALSPLGTLRRGYSICFEAESGKVVRDYRDVDVGERVRIRFARGQAISKVEQTGEASG